MTPAIAFKTVGIVGTAKAPLPVDHQKMKSAAIKPPRKERQSRLTDSAGNDFSDDFDAQPIMTPEERMALNSGRWFSGLSSALRHDILRHVYIRHYRDDELILARGEPANEWVACAKGAARVSSTSLSGKQITFAYIEPGIWFGDVAMFDGDKRTHDVYAHGETTMACVARVDFEYILSEHVELYEALMRLQARRIRQLFGLLEDLNTLPLRARLAKQLLHLQRSYGVAALNHPGEFRISLHLAQEELAQLLGASRQRVNQELKSMEREEAIRIEPGGIVIRHRELLLAASAEVATS
jgi:CRP-like cAMP-binding protein